jgi:hypothetical protein
MSRLGTAARIVLFCVVSSAASAAEVKAPVRVIEPGELTPASYTVVERLWTGTWRSAFWTTTHDTSDAAITLLTREAEQLGADAVTDLACFRDSGTWFSPEGYFCSGLAIKLR